MAEVRVVRSGEGHRLVGDGAVVVAGNSFLEHLVVRRFSPATVRAYAFDVANFGASSLSGCWGWRRSSRAICSTISDGNRLAVRRPAR